MIIRALDSNDDWTFGNGKGNYLKDEGAIATNIRTRLRQWREDCFYASGEGVDYNNLMSIGTKTLLDQDVLRIVTQSFGVLRIVDFDSTIEDERSYTASMTIETIYSTNITIGV